ncbi:hypothetical protein AYK25_05610 [Thermoplasmatales archaeon SM1-50]|nr:MAG: hypothetical protein AYK25_05610 [Thermoplasmatales archaeon SM1-50]
MKRKLISIVVCMLMFAAIPALQGMQHTEVNETTIVSAQTGVTRQPGTILIDFDAQTAHTETGSLGVEWVPPYFWSTCRGLVNPTHMIFKWDINGSLIASYPQPAQTSSWGMRDMAYDGTYLYAGSENGFWQIDPATGATTLMFSSISPMTIIRALAWVPTENMFYTGSFSLGWFKFTADGTTITPVANPGLAGVYGMAYDDINDTIWVFDQAPAAPNRCTFAEYDYHTGTLTGNTWLVPMLTGSTDQVAGGNCYMTDCITNKATLGGLSQGTPVDRIFVMELGDVTTNSPPVTPAAPTGPSTGFVGVSYDFTAQTDDPELDDIYYWFDWDDGTNSGWLGPFASGTATTASKTWTAADTYNVTVKAKDTLGAESGFSPAHVITIAVGPTLEIGNITGGLFKIKAIIKNTGGGAANNINWSIKLNGGFILLGKETTGTIVAINGGDEREITSKAIIGLGKTVVTVSAACPESSATKDVNATVLLFFIKI